MEFRFEEKGFWVDPSLSEEQREEVTKGMRRVLEGAKQNFVGEKRREMAEGFLEAINPERRQKLEADIAALHTTKDEARFRIQVVLLLVDAFVGGMAFERIRQEEPSGSEPPSKSSK